MTTLKNDMNYENEVLSGIKALCQKVSNATFEQCQFLDCDFSESEFIECRFIDCEFRDSNLNVTKLTGSRFFESQFNGCKVTGINWTSLDWTGITVSAPMAFESCDLSFSVFNSLHLPGLTIKNCKAWNVDFESCDLTHSEFTNTDLQDARFNGTKLDKSDFDGSVNYYIDPMSNSIRHANFSFPEVINLLKAFDIKITGSD
tara:strand:- start:734 stop:1339 length:606 start_codon:yes stop_codon:yes gene_type:complete